MPDMVKRERPPETHGHTLKLSVGCGTLYVVLGYDDDEVLIEVLAYLGKSGTCAKAMTEALTRVITLALKYSVPIKEIVDELIGIRCQLRGIDTGLEMLSCPDAIAKILYSEG